MGVILKPLSCLCSTEPGWAVRGGRGYPSCQAPLGVVLDSNNNFGNNDNNRNSCRVLRASQVADNNPMREAVLNSI